MWTTCPGSLYSLMQQPGVETAACWLQVQRSNHHHRTKIECNDVIAELYKVTSIAKQRFWRAMRQNCESKSSRGCNHRIGEACHHIFSPSLFHLCPITSPVFVGVGQWQGTTPRREKPDGDVQSSVPWTRLGPSKTAWKHDIWHDMTWHDMTAAYSGDDATEKKIKIIHVFIL